MTKKEMQARIAELERENRDSMDKISGLYRTAYERADHIKELEAEKFAEKEKYAALLERHISMMEKMAGLKVEGGE